MNYKGFIIELNTENSKAGLDYVCYSEANNVTLYAKSVSNAKNQIDIFLLQLSKGIDELLSKTIRDIITPKN